MRWSGSDEAVTGAIAVGLILAALFVIAFYSLQLLNQAGMF